jgi:hypothetical protein
MLFFRQVCLKLDLLFDCVGESNKIDTAPFRSLSLFIIPVGYLLYVFILFCTL